MAWIKTASAKVIRASVDQSYWNARLLEAGGSQMRTASSVVTSEYDPSQWLLTHCTIVASVDTEDGPGSGILGRTMVEGQEIERRYADYRVKADHDDWINNNHDCWERRLLLGSYQTFRGAYNFVEHVQVPDLSKGTIVDAAARDIGPSVYIDILVATNRKHASLVHDIETNKMMTLSMGAIVAFTICTKCGNVAVDETDLCRHIKYEKGNYFIAEDGTRRRVAELCGHRDVPDSNKFIEASWVRDPAFAGAVLRNVLHVNPGTEPQVAHKIQIAYELGKRQLPPDQMLKVASQIEAGLFDVGQQGQGGGDDQGGGQAPSETKKDKLVKELSDELMERAKEKARQQLLDQGQEPPADLGQDNDNVVHSSTREVFQSRFASSGLSSSQLDQVFNVLAVLRRTRSWKRTASELDLDGQRLLMAAHFIDCYGTPSRSLTIDGYHAIVAVGGTHRFASAQAYLQACGQQMGRNLTKDEAEVLIRRGQIYSLGHRAGEQA
jgi:hypothetical protein